MNRKQFAFISMFLVLFLGAYYAKAKYYDPKHQSENIDKEIKGILDSNKLRDGDIIFQTSLSGQSIAIQHATKSKYSHCGIIYRDKGVFYVYEAIQPVKYTPLKKWILRGKDARCVVKRLKNADEVLTPSNLAKMKKEGEKFKGKNYDLTFEWSDNKMYCSELIWKIYKRATGVEVGKLEKLGSFDLSNSLVKKKLKERYGDKIPIDETVISPAAIFDCNLLETVYSN